MGTPLPRIRGRLLRSTQLGAEACRANGQYEVRLSAALPAIVHFAFNCLLRIPGYMHGIGDAASEQRYRENSGQIPLALPEGVAIERSIVAITGLSRPRDLQRAATAVLMAELAVAFCGYHELAHVVLGHVDAHWRQSKRSRLLELAPRSASIHRGDAMTRQVWEYEADLVAANMLLQDVMSVSADVAFRDAYGGQTEELDRFQAMLGAVLVVFLLVAQATPARCRTHPEPLVRFAAVANDSSAALVEQQPQLDLGFEVVEEAVDDVASATLGAWRALGLGTSRASPLRNLLTARSTVERLEAERQRRHSSYSGLASFYPFKD